MYSSDYPHHEIYNNIDIYYYLLPEKIPHSLDIEPIYEIIGGERCADGKISPTKKVLKGINVYGRYEICI